MAEGEEDMEANEEMMDEDGEEADLGSVLS
jgi:hypothetical protein